MRAMIALALACTLCSAQVEEEPHLDTSMQRANGATNIAAQNAGFRVAARVKFTNLQRGDVEGTYSKVWAPQQRYREEIKIGGYLQTRVGDSGKRWNSRNANYPPLRIMQLTKALEAIAGSLHPPAKQFEFKQRDRKIQGRKVECFEYEGKVPFDESQFCFDSQTGALVRLMREYFKAEYSDYQPLGSKLYPHKVRVFQGDSAALELEVIEASAAATTANDFLPPAGSQEEPPPCPEEVSVESFLQWRVQPRYPEESRRAWERGLVILSAIIDKSGVPQNISVVGSAGPRLDKAAIDAISQWRFRPIVACGVAREFPAILTVMFDLK